jgi:hypothetical protein
MEAELYLYLNVSYYYAFHYPSSKTTSLIVYNHNSQNTSFNSRWSKILLTIYELNTIMLEIIFGSLLGDGCLIKYRKYVYFK